MPCLAQKAFSFFFEWMRQKYSNLEYMQNLEGLMKAYAHSKNNLRFSKVQI